MYKVEAYIKPFVVGELLEDLRSTGARILSYMDLAVEQQDATAESDETVEGTSFEKRVRIDILVDSDSLNAVIQVFRDRIDTRMRGGAELVVFSVADFIEIHPDDDSSE